MAGRRWLAMTMAVGLTFAGAAVRAQQDEVGMPGADYKRLDTFEAHTLGKANQDFDARNWRQARAAYDAFLIEFPKSQAVPYALLRKGRCLHLDGKRFEAIKVYNEIMDYFPNALHYAGAALYYLGLAHAENGDEPSATKAWAEVASDADYSKHFLAADAINRLAGILAKNGDEAKAAGYYMQVAIDFRRSNPQAARRAIEMAQPYLVRTRPDEKALREFYRKVESFDERPVKVAENLEKDRDYWGRVRELVRRHGQFTDLQRDVRVAYYRYWGAAIENRFPDWDAAQTDAAQFWFAADGDEGKFFQRLDRQFAAGKTDDMGRIVEWIQLYSAHKKKVMEYYAKLDFARMTTAQIWRLFELANERIGDAALIDSVFRRFPMDKMTDDELARLAEYLWRRNVEMVEQVCRAIRDAERGNMERLRFYQNTQQNEPGIKVADELAKSARYSSEALWIKGELLERARRWQEAITAYRQVDKQPDNLWRIAECYARLGQLDSAVGQLREIEGFFVPQAPEAALRVAYYNRDAGKRDVFIAELRNVLKKYPKSGQSSQAHRELEALGVRIGGGMDAE